VLEEEDLHTWQFEKETAEDEQIRKSMAGKTETGGGASDPSSIGHHGHTMVFQDFVQAIQNGTKPVVDGHEGRRSVEVICAIYESAKSGKTVKLDG
jgi:predicted dehydrogenase